MFYGDSMLVFKVHLELKFQKEFSELFNMFKMN